MTEKVVVADMKRIKDSLETLYSNTRHGKHAGRYSCHL